MSLNIFQRMLAITNDCQKIPKTGYNSFSKYKYVTAEVVINEVQKLLVKHGVCLVISQKELLREKVDRNYFCTVKCQATFINSDDPTQKIEVDYNGIAADTLDKDLYKALTNGLKYLFTEQFLIVTDNVIDVENDRAEIEINKPANKPKNLIPKDILAELTRAVVRTKGDIKKALEWASTAHIDDIKKQIIRLNEKE